MNRPAVHLAAHHKAHIGLVVFSQCAVVCVTRRHRTRLYTISRTRAERLRTWLETLHHDVAAGRPRALWPSGAFMPSGNYSGFLRHAGTGGANHG